MRFRRASQLALRHRSTGSVAAAVVGGEASKNDPPPGPRVLSQPVQVPWVCCWEYGGTEGEAASENDAHAGCDLARAP